MGFEELKALSEGGAWVTLAGVLVWLIKRMLEESAKQRKQHYVERMSQETRHRAERDAIFAAHRAERADWTAAEIRRSERLASSSDKLAEVIERSLRNKP